MAERKIFIVEDSAIREELIDFDYYTGFSLKQKQKSIKSLHDKVSKIYSQKILEISSKSPEILGVNLSAFNLKIKVDDRFISVENIFQASKVFEKGGPYEDLLYTSPLLAKKDERLRNSGPLKTFIFKGKEYPIVPKTLFYDWIYCNTLNMNKELSSNILEYSIFTDIEFNHKKSLNCQAKSAAIFVFLSRNRLLQMALKDINVFKKLLYKEDEYISQGYQQMSMF